MTQNIRVSLRFLQLKDDAFGNFAGNVIDELDKNADVFKNLPVPAAELKPLHETYTKALQATIDRGIKDTAAKNSARAKLQDALRRDALYAEIVANGDLNVLLKSGFHPVSTNRAQQPVAIPQIVAVEHAQSGELKVRVKADRNARSFQGRIKEATGGEFGPVISFASSRKILFTGLTAGVTYVLELCAIGGSTGQSDWTDPTTKMAM
jgi:hypothetical protein